MKHFHISKNLSLPEIIITETIAVLGIRGSGKTTTAKVIIEEALTNKRQVAIIDPTDVWWGLKSGFEIVIFGGAHGDLPLNEDSGKLIADFVVDHGISCILSLRHLRKAAQKRLITQFNEQLYYRKGEVSKRTPICVVIDECDTFIPQRVMGEDAKSVGAVEDLVRRGRNAGIGVVLISQRAASINKDVLTQLTVLIAHKHTGPQDRKALEDWIRGHDTEDRAKTFLESLASLPTGTAWFWAPGLDVFEKVAVNKSKTFDSSATPKLGDKVIAPRIFKPVDLEKLKSQMKEVIQSAEENNPTKLKARIRELEAQNKKIEKVVETKIVEKPILTTADKEILHKIHKLLAGVLEKFGKLSVTDLKYYYHELKNVTPKAAPTHVEKSFRERGIERRSKLSQVDNETQLSKSQFNILRSLYWLKDESKTPAKVAFFSGYTVNGHFNNTLGSLRSEGYVNGWQITEKGIQAFSTFAEPEEKPTGPELREWMRPKLNIAGNKILDVLLLHKGDRISTNRLAEESGYTINGHFNNTLGKLRTLELAEGYERDGGIKINEAFL